MILLDVIILLHLHNNTSQAHKAVAAWVTEKTEADEVIGLPVQTIWSFIRIVTGRAFSRPMTGHEAMHAMALLLESNQVKVIHPGPRHFDILKKFVADENATGDLVPDAVLAAMALEIGATVASTDNDFRRFAVPWINPLS